MWGHSRKVAVCTPGVRGANRPAPRSRPGSLQNCEEWRSVGEALVPGALLQDPSGLERHTLSPARLGWQAICSVLVSEQVLTPWVPGRRVPQVSTFRGLQVQGHVLGIRGAASCPSRRDCHSSCEPQGCRARVGRAPWPGLLGILWSDCSAQPPVCRECAWSSPASGDTQPWAPGLGAASRTFRSPRHHGLARAPVPHAHLPRPSAPLLPAPASNLLIS